MQKPAQPQTSTSQNKTKYLSFGYHENIFTPRSYNGNMHVYVKEGTQTPNQWTEIPGDKLNVTDHNGVELTLIGFDTNKVAQHYGKEPLSIDDAVNVYLYSRSRYITKSWSWLSEVHEMYRGYALELFTNEKLARLENDFKKSMKLEFFDGDNQELLEYAEKKASRIEWMNGLTLVHAAQNDSPYLGKLLREAERDLRDRCDHMNEYMIILSIVVFCVCKREGCEISTN